MPAVRGRGVSILSRNQLPGLQSEPGLKTIAVENKLFDVNKIGLKRKPSPAKSAPSRSSTTSGGTSRGGLSQTNKIKNMRANNQLLSLDKTASAFNTANGLPNTPMLLDTRQGVSKLPFSVQRTESTNINNLFDSASMSSNGQQKRTPNIRRGPGKVNIELRLPVANNANANLFEAGGIKAIQTDGSFLGSSSAGPSPFSTNSQSPEPLFHDQASLLNIVKGQIKNINRQEILFPNPIGMPYTGPASAWDRKPKLPTDLDIFIPSHKPVVRTPQRITIGPPPPFTNTFPSSRPPVPQANLKTQNVPYPTPVSSQPQGPQYILPTTVVPIQGPVPTIPTISPQSQGEIRRNLDTNQLPIDQVKTMFTDVPAQTTTDIPLAVTTPPVNVIPTTTRGQAFAGLDIPTSVMPKNTAFVEPSGIPPTIVPADTINVKYDMSVFPNNENWAIFDPTSLPPNVNFTDIGPIVDLNFEKPIHFTSNTDIQFQNSISKSEDATQIKAQAKDTYFNGLRTTSQPIKTDSPITAVIKPSTHEKKTRQQNTVVTGPPPTTVPTHLDSIVPVVDTVQANPQYQDMNLFQDSWDIGRVDLPPPPPPI